MFIYSDRYDVNFCKGDGAIRPLFGLNITASFKVIQIFLNLSSLD